MPQSVTDVYKWVVDDVVQKVQELFVQEGIEQSVLNELKETWLKKLQDSGVMGDPNEEPVPRTTLHDPMRNMSRSRQSAARRIQDPQAQRYETGVAHSLHATGMSQHIGVPGFAGQFARVDGRLPPAALGLPQQNLRAQVVLPPECGLAPHPYMHWTQPQFGYLTSVQSPQVSMLRNLQSVRPGGTQPAPSGTVTSSHGVVHGTQVAGRATHQHAPNSYQHVRTSGMHSLVLPQRQMAGAPSNAMGSRASDSGASRGDVAHSGYAAVQGSSVKRKAPEGTSQSPTKVLKVEGNPALLPGRIPQQDGAHDDACDDKDGKGVASENQAVGAAPGPVDDPLGSEEDPPLTDDEEEEEWDSPNFLTAQYEKVSRNKTKWRCALKFGIFHANGQDYLFRTANGEFEF